MENEAALEIQQIIKICVENLPPDSTEREIAQLFEKYGKVYAVTVKNSAKSPYRFSIVEMQLSAGLEAVQALDSYTYVVLHKVVPLWGLAESHTPCETGAGSHIKKGNKSCRDGNSDSASGKPDNSSMLKP